MELLLLYSVFARLDQDFVWSGVPRVQMSKLRGVLHNAAMLCIALQICTIYVVAGLTKVHGTVWWNGTALYYALVDPEFSFPGISELLYSNEIVVAVLSYGSVLFQVSFPFLLFLNRWTRVVAVVVAISFHLGIAFGLGLISFAFFMIAGELALINDGEYAWVKSVIGRSKERLSGGWRGASASSSLRA